MAPPKLTKVEKLVQEQMLALLEWAADRPKSWPPIGELPADATCGPICWRLAA
jgi:hypothetical protein